MNTKQELLNIMQEHNMTIEQIAPLISTQPKKLQRRFDEDKIRFSDAQNILDILGYDIVFKKDYLK